MSTNGERLSDGLRAEISTVGARASGRAAENYLAETTAEQVVEDLRRAVAGGAVVGTTLGLILRLDDATLGLILAALRDGAEAIGRREEAGAQPDPVGALAESYMENYKLSAMLEAAVAQLSRLLARMERAGTVLESDAGTRAALRVVGIFTLWREEPEGPQVAGMIEELAEDTRRGTEGAGMLLVGAGRSDAGKSAAAAGTLSERGRRVVAVGDAAEEAE